ncbi:uncharacterized protein At3g49140-like isoform X2 [Salvia splendens]|uniref:uncharacterized protein At3g49140-like isoform X2 n=1 Tax=Salvia splendens TaxID=180675 RepID=UPI001C257324|nr:uncharacterized protein At3g49140-like isoform X2 [Salvia splendens]
MLVSTTPPPSSSSFSLGCSNCLRCHVEPMICSVSHGLSCSSIKTPFELQRVSQYSGLRREHLFGSAQFHWSLQGRDICVSQVSVAADYSDSVPDSSSYATGYHPLEELRDNGRARDAMPTSAEIARTAVEANSKALLIFPSSVHYEPHEQISWAEFDYVIDDFGDIFVEVHDSQNILQDHGASNPVVDEPNKAGIWNDWGMSENSNWTHPVYFAKCLSKAINVEHTKKMDRPSNGVAVWGFLKPTFIDEEFYLRRLFHDEESDSDTSDCKDGDIMSYSTKDDGRCGRSTIYRLDIAKIELFSVYGIQSMIGIQDFQYAEPDILVHSNPSILERFVQTGKRCSVALKALCKKKGLHVEGANLIGVDSLGMDVRVYSGTEVRTHRFSFKTRATSECAADKQIQQLLFPRARRKKLKTLDKPRDDPY